MPPTASHAVPTLAIWQNLVLLVPAATAAAASVAVSTAGSIGTAWRRARSATVLMVIAAAAAVAARVATGARAGLLLRSDTVGVAMAALVAFIGWIVVRYSQQYLAGDPDQHRYLRRMLATLACVAVVVVANDLVLLVVAWSATSVSLHGLLTFFRERPVAVTVAHKKFILARCADAAMIGATIAFGTTFHTLRIDRIAERATEAGALPAGARVGIVLVALAAILKCAQLPFHGWLIQVMEAPTPVSALLHAGVVNLGGFVLLRFAPVVDRTIEARVLLVAVGTLTAVIAALVMTTRVSIKVALAWSTCAQMGFMLMQCGLGVWEMALLHLLAHSMYKAYAFLGAGGTVRQTQRRQLAGVPATPSLASYLQGCALAAAGVLVVGWAWSGLPFAETPTKSVWLLAGIVALALVPLAAPASGRGRRYTFSTAQAIVTVALAYFGLHTLAHHLVHGDASTPIWLAAFVGAAFVALFAVQAACAIAPESRIVTGLRPWIYGGFFLDEAFTRLAFAIRPPRVPAPAHPHDALPRTVVVPVIGHTASVPAASSHHVH